MVVFMFISLSACIGPAWLERAPSRHSCRSRAPCLWCGGRRRRWGRWGCWRRCGQCCALRAGKRGLYDPSAAAAPSRTPAFRCSASHGTCEGTKERKKKKNKCKCECKCECECKARKRKRSMRITTMKRLPRMGGEECHRIASHRIASHRIASHRAASTSGDLYNST